MLRRNSNDFDLASSRIGLLRRILPAAEKPNGSNADGADAQLEQTICQECTNPIEPDALFCQKCHAPVVRRYCPKCSKLVPENSKFCPLCGAPANAAPRFHKHHIQTILGILAGIAFIAYVVVNSTKATVEEKVAADHQLKAKTPAAPAPPVAAPIQASAVATSAKPASLEEGAQLNLQAHKLITEQRYAEAIPILERALTAFPEGSTDITHKYVLYNLGHSLRRIGRFSEAQKYLEKCVSLDGSWDKALTELAIVRAKLMPAPPSATVQNTSSG